MPAAALLAVALLAGATSLSGCGGSSTTRPDKTAIARLPARDALVLGRRDGKLVAGIAVRPSGDAMATFIAPVATAADVGPVTINGAKTTSCGVGCYRGKTRPARIVVVRHGGRTLRFDLGLRQPAAALRTRINRTYRHARSLEYTQRTDSGLGRTVVAHWTEIAPNSFAYRIDHGAQAIVIGNRRWDRDPGKPWRASKTLESNAITPPWGDGHPLTNAHILRRTRRRVVLSFLGADRTYPAWFTVAIDPRTTQIRSIDMNAASHFMHSTYSDWNRPTTLQPPK